MSLTDSTKAELSIFIVTHSSNINGPAADISDINGISSRIRRRHTKSRSGCSACKKRRVKCDNTYPRCRICVRRGEFCSLSKSTSQCTTLKPASLTLSHTHGMDLQRVPCPGFHNGLSVLQMTLFQNFAQNTWASIPFGGNIWHDKVIHLALKHDYLMHAVLLVSARHLSYLSPNNPEYHHASLFHLSKLLPRYREEVVKSLSVENGDSLMSVGFLLLHFVWSNVDAFDTDDTSCFIKDQLFAITPGVREMFISASFLLRSGQSIFSKSTTYHPKYKINKAARQCSLTPSHFEQLFCDTYQKHSDSAVVAIDQGRAQSIPRFADIQNNGSQINHNDLWYAVTQDCDQSLIGFLDAAVRLAPLSSISSELHKSRQDSPSCGPATSKDEIVQKVLSGSSLTTEDLARYVFTWPIVCSPGVLYLLAHNDKRMIFLLYQFYKTIQIILPRTYWWAHQRADKMTSLLNNLMVKEALDPPDSMRDSAVPKDVVANVMDFAAQANERWRQYSLMYALGPELQYPEPSTPDNT